ncbi:unnamed protein product [Rotaria socialis]|uniref:Reverse transcriptase domain-containing protein n=1 Tax=Rotaria socialis TaxID=392032 RepID=A0A820ANR8_9BILA|nr:unnamed protein product [Rotaria socialis]CAF4194901.1 unnamed protein product [Rotaria socialis]CAF4676734.1 unnamed protein product [Rotaria socialis]
MKSRKAPGNDEITADLLKAGGEPVIKWLHEIFSDVWKHEEMVEEWNLAILIKLFKKGDKQLCDNYRGISLLSVTSKLLSRIILNRIQLLVDSQLLEAQSGFRSNRSTINQIFTLKLCMDKRREFNKPLFMCFIDISKAYDSVNRELLWKVCRKYGISEKLVNLLKMLYTNSKAKVKINGEFSDSFEIYNGVMQGGIPSPILFNILFYFIIRKVIEEADVIGVQFSYGRNDSFHGVNLGDRMSNDKILEITGQPPIETILRRNRLRWAVNRRNDDLAASHGLIKRKVTEILVKSTNNHYACPGCGIQLKPQGITNHVKSCVNAQVWCKNNKIKF